MVKLRLRRVGMKKQPSYRVVATDSRAARDGSFLETIGHYNPRTEPATLTVNEDLALKWLRKGAQPTETVERLFRRLGIMEKVTAAS